MSETRWAVGQDVYVVDSNRNYSPGKIVKVTPSGMADVQIGPSHTYTKRFRPDGRESSGDRWYRCSIDPTPIEERRVLLKRAEAVKVARTALAKIYDDQNVSFRAEVDEISGEINRIQGLMDAALAALAKARGEA